MHGLIFAAGLGTRLRPLTNDRPKALIEVQGVPMLDRVAAALVEAGCDRLVVNVHHFATRVVDHLATRDYGVPVEVSREDDGPYETGGGLWHARALLRGADRILVHNVDVWTDLPLARVVAAHAATHPLATVAVADRETSRYLRFDDDGLLGRADRSRDWHADAREARGHVYERAFNGIHVVDAALLDEISERGRFSILDPYLRLVAEGASIQPYFMDDWQWFDIGSHARLDALREALGD